MFSLNKKLRFIIPIVVFFILFLIFNQLSATYESKLKTQENKVISSELKAHATSIKESVDKRFIILNLLKSYIERNIDKNVVFDLDNKELEVYVRSLYDSVKGIRALQVSPNGIHTFVYPLKSNEKTLKRNLFHDKRTAVIEMLKLTQKSKDIITNAPYHLRQGGFGLVARQAIRDDGEFWGFVAMVLDMGYILNHTSITNKEDILNLAIYQNGKIIFGNMDIDYQKAHKVPFSIANQDLMLIANRKSSLSSTTLLLINISIVFISALSAFIIFILLSRQKKLESSVIQSMKKLEEKNKELEALIQEAPNPIMLYNEDGEVLVVNKIWLEITKYKFDEINTIEKWASSACGTKNINFKKHINTLYKLNKKVDEGEFIVYTKNHEKRVWQFSSVIFGTIDGKKTVISSAMDITEIKEKENILLRQSKMASIGEMLENIAHQWRQPLSVISTASTGVLLKQDVGILKEEELKISMNRINQSAQYLSSTIDYFREFLLDKGDLKEISIKATLQKTIDILSPKLKNRNIEIITDVEDVEFKCIENDLIQVFMIMLSNAQDALEKVENKKLIFIDIYKNDKNIIIKIKDSAGGIDESIIEKIFEPYFTTKHKSQGTGIGLYMTENIVTKHLNGIVEVINTKYEYEEEQYTGAQFIMTLPLKI